MSRIIFALVLCALSFSARAAEEKPATLRLKNGKVLEGMVLSESDTSVEFKIGTMKATYTKQEIAEVEYLYVETLAPRQSFSQVAAKNPDLARNEKFVKEAEATLQKYPGIPPEAAWELTAQIYELRTSNERYKQAMWRLQASTEEANREADTAKFDAHQARREAVTNSMQPNSTYRPTEAHSRCGTGPTWTTQQAIDQYTGAGIQGGEDYTNSTRRNGGGGLIVIQKGPIQTPDGRIDPEASANKVQTYGNAYVVRKGPVNSTAREQTSPSQSTQQSPEGEAQMRQAWGWRDRNKNMSNRIQVPEDDNTRSRP